MKNSADQYSKVYEFTPNNTLESGTSFWFHQNTVTAKNGFNGLLATNRSGITTAFTVYSYGENRRTQTNYLLLSENIQNGLTTPYTASQGWYTYGGQAVAGVYSTIRMPDGTTNGVLMQTILNSNNGIYQTLRQPNVVSPGKMYTFSVWACVDTVGGFPSTGTMRLSYFNDSVSAFSPNFSLTTTPQRFSWTFVANNPSSSLLENLAIGNGSGTPAAIRMVLWGAQLVEGNTAGRYLPTDTVYNGFRTANSVAGATATSGEASGDDYQIVTTSFTLPANSSSLFNIGGFAIATNNSNNVAPPSELFIYGLY